MAHFSWLEKKSHRNKSVVPLCLCESLYVHVNVCVAVLEEVESDESLGKTTEALFIHNQNKKKKRLHHGVTLTTLAEQSAHQSTSVTPPLSPSGRISEIPF